MRCSHTGLFSCPPGAAAEDHRDKDLLIKTFLNIKKECSFSLHSCGNVIKSCSCCENNADSLIRARVVRDIDGTGAICERERMRKSAGILPDPDIDGSEEAPQGANAGA